MSNGPERVESDDACHKAADGLIRPRNHASNMDLGAFGHESWRTAAGTLLGYGIILLAMFVLLFLIPFVVFTLL